MSAISPVQRAITLMNQGSVDQAIALIRRAVQTDSSDPNAVSLLGVLLFTKGDYAQAEFYARRSVQLMPENPEAWTNLGSVFVALRKYEEAVAPLERALELRPDDPPTRITLSLALTSLGRRAPALQVLQEGVRRMPHSAQLLGHYAYALHGAGRIQDALATLRRSLLLDPADLSLADCLCSLLTYAPGIEPLELLRANTTYGDLLARRTGTPPRPARHARAGPIRVGLISPDFRSHSVAYVIESLLEHADRSRIFVACFSSTHHEDAVTDRLRSKSDLWRGIASLKPAAAAEIIRRDRMDVLIDLAGHTGGHSLEVMALRPAPVQMTYAGWPGTTGVAAIDFRITDTITDPPEADPFSTERLLRLDPCAVSYRPAGAIPHVAVPGAGPVTFASFGAPTKFNRPLLVLWARILREVPGSRLLIKHLGLGDPAIREGVAGQAIDAGIRPDSFEVLPPSQGLDSHLSAYHSVHVSLDTLPYNGTVTICESLLMGVPVVSMCGNTTAGRVALSILSAAGVPELCAADGDAYVRLAVELATDPARLHRVRTGLRERFLASPVCDGPGFARRFTDLIIPAASLQEVRPDRA